MNRIILIDNHFMCDFLNYLSDEPGLVFDPVLIGSVDDVVAQIGVVQLVDRRWWNDELVTHVLQLFVNLNNQRK